MVLLQNSEEDEMWDETQQQQLYLYFMCLISLFMSEPLSIYLYMRETSIL